MRTKGCCGVSASKMKKAGVYAITHTATGRRYVGSSADLVRRQQLHWRHLRQGGHHSPRLQHAFNKYGEHRFEFRVLERIDHDEAEQLRSMLRRREQYHMDASTSGLFNASPCSESCLGTKRSLATRRKISASIELAWSRPETKERISLAIRRAFLTEEDKARRSKVCADPGYREKMSAAVRKALSKRSVRRNISEATKAALSRPEIRQKLSAAAKAMHARPGFKERHAAATRIALSDPRTRRRMKASRRAFLESSEGVAAGEKHSRLLKRKYEDRAYRDMHKAAMAKPEAKKKLLQGIRAFWASPAGAALKRRYSRAYTKNGKRRASRD